MKNHIMLAGLIMAIVFGANLQAVAQDEVPGAMPRDRLEAWQERYPDSLPNGLTPDELNNMDKIGLGFTRSAAPPGPVRQPGEFEPMQGVLIRYPFGISYAVIKEMAEDTEVVTIVSSTSQQNTVISLYQQNGVNLNNCSFLIAASDSMWTRDYGPWCIIDGNGDAGIVDIIYNRPRPNDDKIPTKYAQDQGIPYFAMDYIGAGGNYMCDGQGIAASTTLVWSENPSYTKQEIRDMVDDYLGVYNYHVVPDVLGQYIKHIDCWGKFLSPDTILIIEFPTSHSQYDEAEDAVAYWESQNCCYGYPYKVARVYSPGGQPYTNSLILNKKVLVPITGSQWDDDAIQAYEDAMPGYEVLGFTGSWYDTDALHCRTMGLTDREMLYVHHVPLHKPTPGPAGFSIEAEVIAFSGQPLVNNTPLLYWDAGSGWNSVQMSSAGGNTYSADIPPYPDGTMIKYYIRVADGSGREEFHPYIGQAGAHEFTVFDPVLGTDVDTISVRDGGIVNFLLNAGLANAGRSYFLLGSVSGTNPGTPLPGGTTLPLNWDTFTGMVFKLANTPVFLDFQGILDGEGRAAAQMNSFGPLTGVPTGVIMHFAYTLYGPFGYVSPAVQVETVQ